MPLSSPSLPPTRGSYTFNAELKNQVWFRVGGPAEVLFKPKDTEDLQFFLKHLPPSIPLTLIGVGSNLLIRDGGVPGVTIKLGKGFNSLKIEESYITVGAAALDRTVALECAHQGVAGLEFMSGIPGTIGGAVKMNAGAYGREVKDCLVSCDIVTRSGILKTLLPKDLKFSYRHSGLSDEDIVVHATFKGHTENPQIILDRITEIMKTREDTQPVRARTGGSTFKNPLPHKAWELIDQAGCRGLKKGGAQISEKHCNFLINTGNATAGELESLADEVQQKVTQKSGIKLQWEIRRIGEKK